jgi:hypothetical protein
MMNHPAPYHRSTQGVSLAEYGALTALLLITVMGSMQLLGYSISDLLSQSQQTLTTQSTISVLNPIPSSAGNGLSPQLNSPNTGIAQPAMGLTDTGNNYTNNLTSVEGTQLDTVGSLILGKQLQALADAQTDPEARDYYAEMAHLAYYMGAAEGELDNVVGLDLGSEYTDGDALQEVYDKQKALKALMDNPPANLKVSAGDQEMVLALATKVYDIADLYSSSLSRFIKNGKVTTHFDMGNNESGDGTPGNIYKNAALLKPKNSGLSKSSFEDHVDYNEMKSLADKVIAQHSATKTVETTLKNAKKIDETSTSSNTESPKKKTL